MKKKTKIHPEESEKFFKVISSLKLKVEDLKIEEIDKKFHKKFRELDDTFLEFRRKMRSVQLVRQTKRKKKKSNFKCLRKISICYFIRYITKKMKLKKQRTEQKKKEWKQKIEQKKKDLKNTKRKKIKKKKKIKEDYKELEKDDDIIENGNLSSDEEFVKEFDVDDDIDDNDDDVNHLFYSSDEEVIEPFIDKDENESSESSDSDEVSDNDDVEEEAEVIIYEEKRKEKKNSKFYPLVLKNYQTRICYLISSLQILNICFQKMDEIERTSFMKDILGKKLGKFFKKKKKLLSLITDLKEVLPFPIYQKNDTGVR